MKTGSSWITPKILPSGLVLFGLFFAFASAQVMSLPALRVDANVPLVKIAEYHTLEARYAPAAVQAGKFIYIIGGLGADRSPLASIERFDLENNTCELYARLRVPRFEHRAVLVGNKIFVVGEKQPIGDVGNIGLSTENRDALTNRAAFPRPFSVVESHESDDQTELIDSVEMIDLTTRTVTACSAMPEKLSGFSIVAAQRSFQIFGGRINTADSGNAKAFTRRSFQFDADKMIWSKGAPIPLPGEVVVVRVDPAHLVAMGGYNGTRAMSDVLALNEANGTWNSLPALVRPVSAASAVFLQKYIFLFGDYAHPENILVYDLMTKKSEILQLKFTPTRHSGAVAFDNKIYVIGGKPFKESDPLAMIQVFALTKSAFRN